MNRHPLFIENVIQEIIQYFDHPRRADLRGVHPSWNSAILTPIHISKSKLVLDFKDKDVNEFVELFPVKHPACRKVSDKLPTVVEISHFGSMTDPYKLIQWFRRYGCFITELSINHKDFEDLQLEVAEYSTTIRQQIPHLSVHSFNPKKSEILLHILSGELSNLEHLRIPVFDFVSLCEIRQKIGLQLSLEKLKSLEIATGSAYLPRNVDPKSLNMILKAAPNLELLKLVREPVDQTSQLQSEKRHKFFFGINTDFLAKLTVLDLSNIAIEFTQFQRLARTSFVNLKRLILLRVDMQNLLPCPVWHLLEEECYQLFENVENSLEYLNAGSLYVFFHKCSVPKAMHVLKELVHTLDVVHTDSVSVLEQFPKLEILRLSQKADERRNLFAYLIPPRCLRGPLVLITVLELTDMPLTGEPFERLVGAFPSLVKFSVLSTRASRDENERDLIWDVSQFFNLLTQSKFLKELRITVSDGVCEVKRDAFMAAMRDDFRLLTPLQLCSITCITGAMDLPSMDEFQVPQNLERLELRNFRVNHVLKPELMLLFPKT